MTTNCSYTCGSLYKLEGSTPEQMGLSFSRKSKYVAHQRQKYASKFPKTEKTGEKTHKSQHQKGQTTNFD